MSIQGKGLEGQGNMSISAEEYAELMEVKAELRQRRVSDKVKGMGSSKSGIYRQRLVMRRVNVIDHAPDEDLVAYDAIHRLKNPAGDSKQKTIVTDSEIKAYKALDPDFNKTTITLADVLAKVDDLKAKGQLTKADDNPGEDIIEEEVA